MCSMRTDLAPAGLQTGESWNRVMHAKAHGARNLDRAVHGITTLEHFVMWSSIVAVAGNEGIPLG